MSRPVAERRTRRRPFPGTGAASPARAAGRRLSGLPFPDRQYGPSAPRPPCRRRRSPPPPRMAGRERPPRPRQGGTGPRAAGAATEARHRVPTDGRGPDQCRGRHCSPHARLRRRKAGRQPWREHDGRANGPSTRPREGARNRPWRSKVANSGGGEIPARPRNALYGDPGRSNFRESKRNAVFGRGRQL